MFGKNTEEDREKLKEELEEVHTLFKTLVSEYRPNLDIEAVSTGEHWYGTRALELGLIDELGSSDDYLISAIKDSDVFHVSFKGKQTLQEKIMSVFESSLERAGLWFSDLQNQSRFR
jgi:serine protease SohB